jgi:ComF family protein
VSDPTIARRVIPAGAAAAVLRAADAFVAVVFAPRCAACDVLLERPLAGVVCARCWESIGALTPPLCEACGDPLPSWRAHDFQRGICPRCRRATRAVDLGRSVGEYDGALRRIVHALKYDGRRSLARPLAALMRTRGADLISGAHCAVPVPLHPGRQRSRGFNQADDLAAHLGLPVAHLLRRVRRTLPQVQLPAPRRHGNVRDAFALSRRWFRRDRSGDIEGRCVLLVDDVTTTGATLEACARVLKAAGAREVRALTAARAVARRR